MEKSASSQKVYKCQFCDAIISAWWTKNKYCSTQCIGLANRTRVYFCVVCYKRFEPSWRTSKRQTCSTECRNVLRTINGEKKRAQKVPHQSNCVICGILFNTFSPKYRRRKACSPSCRTKAAWNNPSRKPRCTKATPSNE